MVIDTSVLLAIFFNEEHGNWCADHLDNNTDSLRMSTVNYSEILILLEDRQPQLFDELKSQLDAMPIRYVSPDTIQAQIAAKARLQFPINLGDCFAYALAKNEGTSIITLNREFLKTDLDIITP